jgi:hypothetical protein
MQFGAFAWLRLKVEPATREFDSFAHAKQSQTSPLLRGGQGCGWIKAASVIPNNQMQFVIFLSKHQPNVLCP